MLKTEQNTNIIKEEGTTDVQIESYNLLENTAVFPLKNQVPKEIFSRQYMIYSNTITPNGEGDYTVTAVIDPYEALFGNFANTTKLNKFINSFSYFRSDIDIEIIIEAPISTFGFYTAYWFPFSFSETPDSGRLYEGLNWTHFVQGNSGYGSIADNESMTLHIPFQHYLSALPVQGNQSSRLFDNYLTKLGRLDITFHAADQINNAGNPTVGLRVFATPRNTVLSGPVHITEAPVMRAQSSNYVDKMKTANLLINASSAAYKAATSSPMYQDAKDSFCSMTGLCSNENNTAAEGNERKGVRQCLYGDTSALTIQPSFQILGDYSPVTPVSTQLISVPDIGPDLYEMCRRWSYAGDGLISKTGSVNHPLFYVHPEYNTPGYPNMERKAGYIPFFQRFFRYWRGSLEYKIIIFAPPLITARVQVMIQMPYVDLVPLVAESESIGDMITYTATTRGTTELAFTVPFIYPEAWRPTGRMSDFEASNNLKFIVRAFPYTSPEPTTLVPYLVLWRTGSDFLFSGLKSAGDTLQAAPPVSRRPPKKFVKGKMIAQGLFNGPEESQPLGDGSPLPQPLHVNRACTGSLAKIMSRASTRVATANSFANPGKGIRDANDWVEVDIFDQLSMLYVFWSGSLSFKANFSDQVPSNDVFIGSVATNQYTDPGVELGDYRSGNAVQIIDKDIWPLIEVTVPFFCKLACSPVHDFTESSRTVQPDILTIVDTSQSVIPTQHVLVTPGHDFGLYILWPPPLDKRLPQYQLI